MGRERMGWITHFPTSPPPSLLSQPWASSSSSSYLYLPSKAIIARAWEHFLVSHRIHSGTERLRLARTMERAAVGTI